MILFTKCDYCGRHPDTPHSTCRGCGAPLEPYPAPFYKAPDPDRYGCEIELEEPSGAIEPNRATVFEKAIHRISGSMLTMGEVAVETSLAAEEFDASIRRWLGD